ncbi:hypothetical protein DRQ18_01555 [bacterium]|nr:MAG: hypothetical protein DRQ18_01555 [bacterium]
MLHTFQYQPASFLSSFKNIHFHHARVKIEKLILGRPIYIRYFPVRNKNGEYVGCLEVTQDITDIKKLEGEKRLLD